MKYKIENADEWIMPTMQGYKLSCCDCGLVHEIDFKIRNKKIYIKFKRNNRATGQIRRHMNKSFKLPLSWLSELSNRLYESKLIHDYRDGKIDYNIIRIWFLHKAVLNNEIKHIEK